MTAEVAPCATNQTTLTPMAFPSEAATVSRNNKTRIDAYTATSTAKSTGKDTDRPAASKDAEISAPARVLINKNATVTANARKKPTPTKRLEVVAVAGTVLPAPNNLQLSH